MKKLLASVVLTSFILLVALFTPAQGDETGWFSPRNHEAVPWEGLQIAKGASPDVPYVSTPHAIVDEMVRLADVKASDVAYDLGCGDGRLVIAAVKKTGCRGVGIDIDPERIKESRANARAAGVQDRVRFVEQNFFASDIREATVMLIYLFPDVNIRLRAKFLSEMKPGSRLVSHAFDMGDWKPDNSASIGAQRVYYWVIPANATGTWTWRSQDGRRTVFMLKMEQRYQVIRGTLTQGDHPLTLTDAKLTGDRISFRIEQDVNGVKTTREFSGAVEGNAIHGTIVSTDRAGEQNSRWKAARDPSTKYPIETGFQKSDLLWY
jgi:SAM-dependent methyltransferase